MICVRNQIELAINPIKNEDLMMTQETNSIVLKLDQMDEFVVPNPILVYMNLKKKNLWNSIDSISKDGIKRYCYIWLPWILIYFW